MTVDASEDSNCLSKFMVDSQSTNPHCVRDLIDNYQYR